MKYKEINVKDNVYRIDIWVEKKVVVDIKSVEINSPVYMKQVLTYPLLRTGSKLRLLLNFNVQVMRDGIERIVLGLEK